MSDHATQDSAASSWDVAFMPGEPGGISSSTALMDYLRRLGRSADTAKVFLGVNERGQPAICVVSKLPSAA